MHNANDGSDPETDEDQQGLAEGVIATLTRDKEDSLDANGKVAIYAYTDNDSIPTLTIRPRLATLPKMPGHSARTLTTPPDRF